MKRSEYEAKMKALQDEIEALKKVEIEEEPKRWKPNTGDTYYYVNSKGLVAANTWSDCRDDNNFYSIGNCFKTCQEEDFAVEKLKVIAELKEFTEPDDTKWEGDQIHFFFVYNIIEKTLIIDYARGWKHGELYFASEKDAIEALETVGEDRIKKYIFFIE